MEPASAAVRIDDGWGGADCDRQGNAATARTMKRVRVRKRRSMRSHRTSGAYNGAMEMIDQELGVTSPAMFPLVSSIDPGGSDKARMVGLRRSNPELIGRWVRIVVSIERGCGSLSCGL